jgi:hypothetical protein
MGRVFGDAAEAAPPCSRRTYRTERPAFGQETAGGKKHRRRSSLSPSHLCERGREVSGVSQRTKTCPKADS